MAKQTPNMFPKHSHSSFCTHKPTSIFWTDRQSHPNSHQRLRRLRSWYVKLRTYLCISVEKWIKYLFIKNVICELWWRGKLSEGINIFNFRLFLTQNHCTTLEDLEYRVCFEYTFFWCFFKLESKYHLPFVLLSHSITFNFVYFNKKRK